MRKQPTTPANQPSRPSPHAKAAGHVRIIGGQWRGTRLAVPQHQGLRPSSDRVRETVFNWLNHLWAGQFHDKHIVDAFAGTGVWGLECFSRGARHIDWIDSYTPAINNIRQTLQTWQTQLSTKNQEQCTAHAQDITKIAKTWMQQQRKFDLWIVDPPFSQGWLTQIAPIIHATTHTDSLIYVEVERNANTECLNQLGWTIVRQGQTQQVQYALWQAHQHPHTPE